MNRFLWNLQFFISRLSHGESTDNRSDLESPIESIFSIKLRSELLILQFSRFQGAEQTFSPVFIPKTYQFSGV